MTTHPMPSLRDERGIALVLTLFALVVIGALVAGSFFVGRIEQQTGTNTVWSSQATEAAEAGVSQIVANWDPALYNALPIYTGLPAQEFAVPTVALSGTVQFTDTIRRLNQSLFLVRSVGSRMTPGGQVLGTKMISQLIRLAKPTISVNAAITISSPIALNGNAFSVTGFNANPPGWGMCSPTDPGNTDDLVGIRSATTTGMNAADLNNVFGYPTKEAPNDPSVTSATFRNFLDFTFTTLAAQPNVKVLPDPTVYNGVGPVIDVSTTPNSCDKPVLLNFGEPARNPPVAGAVAECYGFFPIVHGTGVRTKFAAGSRGQGTLLVDGNLEINGGFEWSGLIIVRGQMKIAGNGNKITGAILTEGVDVVTTGAISGNVDITYSKCAVEAAVGGASLGQPLERGWTQLF